MESSQIFGEVLVPFYRGAVVFNPIVATVREIISFSSPFIEERLYLTMEKIMNLQKQLFSSPFIEERLYLGDTTLKHNAFNSSRPLLSRSGCIYS